MRHVEHRRARLHRNTLLWVWASSAELLVAWSCERSGLGYKLEALGKKSEDVDAKLSNIFIKACVGESSTPHILHRFQFHGCYRPRPQVGSEDRNSSSPSARLSSSYVSGSNPTLLFLPANSFSFSTVNFSFGTQILKEIRPDLSEFKCGLAHLFRESLFHYFSLFSFDPLSVL